MAHNVFHFSDLFDFVSIGLGRDSETDLSRAFDVSLSYSLAYFSLFIFFSQIGFITNLYSDTLFIYLH